MDELLVERPRTGVALLRINRPAQRNALSLQLRQAISEALGKLAEEPDIRAVVICGDEKAFASGADIRELLQLSPIDPQFQASQVAWTAMNAYRRPIIAAVRGYALGGGCELALHCDIIVAGRGARFGQPEIRVGIMPGAGGTQRLVRAIGKFKAMRWALTGDIIPVDEAYSMGLVSELVEDDEVVEHSLDLAAKIAALPPLSTEAIKEVISNGEDLPLTQALMLERRTFQLLFAARDRTEGMTAFIERRQPNFTGS